MTPSGFLSILLAFFLLNLPLYSTADGFSDIRGYGSPRPSHRVVNVDEDGARGDGVTDDRKAFEKSWKKACRSHASAVLVVPEKKYLLKPLVFSGPCKSDVTFMIMGTIEASSNRSDWDGRNIRHWIMFRKIENLVITGGGTINGNGQIWWQNSCKINTSLPCTVAPTALTFFECKGLRVEDLRIVDSQQIHVSFENCKNVEASNLSINAPEESPNTDGIHIAHTKNMFITNCDIRTGDDCISIVSGARNVKGMNIFCGPGHGISIGSLGINNTRDHVRNVMMDTVRLEGTQNGVRIKTWQGGRGYAKRIMFQNIDMHNVHNPIIIDQNYCDSDEPCTEQEHAVAVSRVFYKNIKGTSASDVSVKFDCSDSKPCRGIVLQDISFVGKNGKRTTSSCNNVHWTGSGELDPAPCEQGI